MVRTCTVMAEPSKSKCGTYWCPFYKPKGCEDWIRRDRPNSVEMIPPENYEREERKKWRGNY